MTVSPTKHRINIHISRIHSLQLDTLASFYGETKSDIVAHLTQQFYETLIKTDPSFKDFIQIRQDHSEGSSPTVQAYFKDLFKDYTGANDNAPER